MYLHSSTVHLFWHYCRIQLNVKELMWGFKTSSNSVIVIRTNQYLESAKNSDTLNVLITLSGTL